MDSFEANSHSFIVRFWVEPREIEDAKPVWRGVVEHVPSGKKLYLNNLEEIIVFINSYLGEIDEKIKLNSVSI